MRCHQPPIHPNYPIARRFSRNPFPATLGLIYLRPESRSESIRLNSSHSQISYSYFSFFKEPAPTETYTLSLHDALPTSQFIPSPAALAAIHSQQPSVLSTFAQN